MAFKDIKGQEKAVEFFRNSVSKDRLAHAYLFSGPQGLGKTLLAQNLAKFLNCENPVKKESSLIDCCDRCSSCRKIEGSNHPDVHWLETTGRSAKISIDQIRLMQKEISLKAYEGRFKVFIIQDAQRITEEAANCLLKTLEEPPDSSLVILTCTNISGLLPTIISRCQIIKFFPLDYDTIKEILISDYALDQRYVHFLSAASEGRIGRALSLKEDDSFAKKNRIIDKVCATNRQESFAIFNIKDKRNLSTELGY
ncbi:MAG: DNA polymerase III subunit delta', partial [Omnitrophica bacterium]|nr:DNA polymerase III subunit delta' [Candidatus Omnitrophota bacterium]